MSLYRNHVPKETEYRIRGHPVNTVISTMFTAQIYYIPQSKWEAKDFLTIIQRTYNVITSSIIKTLSNHMLNQISCCLDQTLWINTEGATIDSNSLSLCQDGIEPLLWASTSIVNHFQ